MDEIQSLLEVITQQVAMLSQQNAMLIHQVDMLQYHTDMLQYHNSMSLIHLSSLKLSSKTAALNTNSISSLTNSSPSETASINISPISTDDLETISKPPNSDSAILQAPKLLSDRSIATSDDSSHREKESEDKDFIQLNCEFGKNSGFVFFRSLDPRPAMNPAWLNEQKWADAHNMFVEMTKPSEPSFQLANNFDNNDYLHLAKLLANPNVTISYSQNLGERKPLIFDPGGKTELESLLVVRYIHGDAQFYHNPDITTSTSQPPTYDLEDKVDFKGMVMIRQLYSPHLCCCHIQAKCIRCYNQLSPANGIKANAPFQQLFDSTDCYPSGYGKPSPVNDASAGYGGRYPNKAVYVPITFLVPLSAQKTM